MKGASFFSSSMASFSWSVWGAVSIAVLSYELPHYVSCRPSPSLLGASQSPCGEAGEVGEASGPFVAKGRSGGGPIAHRWPVPHPLPPVGQSGVGGEGRSASRLG